MYKIFINNASLIISKLFLFRNLWFIYYRNCICITTIRQARKCIVNDTFYGGIIIDVWCQWTIATKVTNVYTNRKPPTAKLLKRSLTYRTTLKHAVPRNGTPIMMSGNSPYMYMQTHTHACWQTRPFRNVGGKGVVWQ